MKSNEFITSDTHFGHRVVANHRGFRFVDQMDEVLVAAWNAKVPPGAIVYHLGDFSFLKPGYTLRLLQRLNGTIRLVKGNHDKLKTEVAARFDWVKDYYESKTEDGRKVVMLHYPMLTWNGSHHGSWHVHGHSHGNLGKSSTTRVDVGVDTVDGFAPLSFAELEARFVHRSYVVVDHHGAHK